MTLSKNTGGGNNERVVKLDKQVQRDSRSSHSTVDPVGGKYVLSLYHANGRQSLRSVWVDRLELNIHRRISKIRRNVH